jgi:hypothetical protein
MANETQAAFGRYAALIEGAIAREPARPFHAEAERASTVQVERAAAYALALSDRPDLYAATDRVDRLVRLASAGLTPDVAVVDRNGHQRPVYRPLLVYGGLQAFRALYELLPRADFGKWDEGLRAWCDLLEAELGTVRLPDAGSPAANGAAVAQAAWAALALSAAGKVFVRDAWTDLASDTFGRLTRGQTADGTFLVPSPSGHPETWWYHELVLLHAAASYAVQAEDRAVAAAVARATEYHLRETQPDHATSQPWALFPFVWNERTRSLADQVLHGAAVQGAAAPGGADGVSLTLLADALYCLRLFERPAP